MTLKITIKNVWKILFFVKQVFFWESFLVKHFVGGRRKKIGKEFFFVLKNSFFVKNFFSLKKLFDEKRFQRENKSVLVRLVTPVNNLTTLTTVSDVSTVTTVTTVTTLTSFPIVTTIIVKYQMLLFY